MRYSEATVNEVKNTEMLAVYPSSLNYYNFCHSSKIICWEVWKDRWDFSILFLQYPVRHYVKKCSLKYVYVPECKKYCIHIFSCFASDKFNKLWISRLTWFCFASITQFISFLKSSDLQYIVCHDTRYFTIQNISARSYSNLTT